MQNCIILIGFFIVNLKNKKNMKNLLSGLFPALLLISLLTIVAILIN